jgi:uncharacterized protein (DUF1697 family)
MTKYIALVRAVNVGGTTKLPMADLRCICNDAGFVRVETYIASGNVVFESKARPSQVKAGLEARLLAYAGKQIGVVLRTAPELAAVLEANPFPAAEAKHTMRSFSTAVPRAMRWIMRLGKMTRRCASAKGRFSYIIEAAWVARN